MNTQQVQTALSKALNVDIDKIAKANPASEHNLKEEWNATVAKAEEFVQKYGGNKQ